MSRFNVLDWAILLTFAGTAAAGNYNLKTDFGAQGNGIADDSAAFRAAAAQITQDGGGTLYIPGGTYIVGEQSHVTNEYPYYQNELIFEVAELTNALTIYGEEGDTIIKVAPGMRLGLFDKDTGAVYNPTNFPFINFDYCAQVGHVFVMQDCDNVTIENLEIDGNNQNLVLGGSGIDCRATGIMVSGCNDVLMQNVHTHHHGLDGLYIAYAGLTEESEPTPHTLINVISEYNSRQGLSWVGGIGLTAVNCKFNHTGRIFLTAPGAGVDIEETFNTVCRDGLFDTCEFVNNTGIGMVAEIGDSADIAFTNCTFWGSTGASIVVNKPDMVFVNCNIYGGAFCHYSTNDSTGTRFVNCHFEDQKYGGQYVYGDYLVAPYSGGGEGAQFIDCAFVANTRRAINMHGAIMQDCTVLHKYNGLADGSWLSCLTDCYLENVRFSENFTNPPATGWYIYEFGTWIAEDVIVDGPYCKWQNYSKGRTGVIPPNLLTACWLFDEGVGAVAGDSSMLDTYDGAIYGGVSWIYDDRTGNALEFDGEDGCVAIDDDFIYDKSGQIDKITVMAWIRTTNSNNTVVDWDGSEYWSVGVDLDETVGSGKISWNTCGATEGVHNFASAASVDDGYWHHIAVTYDSETGHKQIYIDGSPDNATNAYSAGERLGTGVTRCGFIGVGSEASTFDGSKNNRFFEGIIDDVRIVRHVCGADQIYAQYWHGAFGRWDLDEGSGSVLADSSGKGNDGTIYGAVAWVDGKIGKALEFDGVDDYVSIPSNSSLNITNAITIEAWIKTSYTGLQYFLSKQSVGGKIAFALRNNAWGLYDGAWTWVYHASLADGKWHYYAATYDGSLAAGNMKSYIDGELNNTPTTYTGGLPSYMGNVYLGADPATGNKFHGSLDEVRIFPRALNADEIRNRYKQSTGKWGLNEGEGSLVTDSSGNCNDGTIYGAAAWVDGKIGKALEFNGTNDYVSIPTSSRLNITDAITIEAWIKTSYTGLQYFLSKQSVGGKIAFALRNNAWGLYDGAWTWVYHASLADGMWRHFAATYDKSLGTGNMKFYIDGELNGNPTTYAGGLPSYMGNVYLGADPAAGNKFHGFLDEVRIYPRALSADEIYQHYVEGL